MSEKICEVDGCGSNHKVNKNNKAKMFLCNKHWQQFNKYGYFLNKNKKVCKICGSDYKIYNCLNYGLLCSKHKHYFLKYGKIPERSRYNSNEIVICNDYAEIIVYNENNGNEKSRAIIDLNEVEKIKKYKWHFDGNYFFAYKNNKNYSLHQILFNCDGLIRDHIDRNKLNNRKDNLRIASIQENGRNRTIHKNNSSGFSGIYWDKKREKWYCSIIYNKKSYFLGRFNDIDQAINVRIKKELELYKEFSPYWFSHQHLLNNKNEVN